MKIKGMITQIMLPETGTGKSGKTWTKQDFILETSDQYPKKICFTVMNDKANLSQFGELDLVEVSFNIESREYNGRWYTSVNAWKIEHSNN